MPFRRRKGFTLIELLVVIAIIGILAAMLFPVFARARESARKIQCLSNVKNIAMAFQMYLTDYDAFPPYLSDGSYNDVYDLLLTANAGRSDMCQYRAFQSDPYLRWPVILDEYIRNRDVWNCPSATWMEGFDVVYDPGAPMAGPAGSPLTHSLGGMGSTSTTRAWATSPRGGEAPSPTP
jgi:prepilin-type N-terminal cleavage/methylation domain-containing protein